MNFMDILRTAFNALRGNWLRSALTSLGVIIGIAAVIVMVSIGQGTQAEIDKLVSGLGSQRLDVSPGGGRGPMGGARMSASSFFTLNQGDIDAIREEVPEVQYISGSLRGNTQVVYAENNASTSWQGVQPDFFTIYGWELARGELFEPGDYGGNGRRVIIGDSVRRNLFGDGDGIGETIRLGRTPMQVAGTLAPKGPGMFGQDQDDVVLVPLETARRRLMGSMGLPPGAVMNVGLTVDDPRNLDYVQGEVEALLRQEGYAGILAYSLTEAVWAAGWCDDVLMGYPTADRRALAALLADERACSRVTLMVDAVDHLDLVDSVAPPGQRREVRVAIDLDLAYDPPRAGRLTGRVGVCLLYTSPSPRD